MDDNAQSWLAQFEEANGRPLRVLHYGNIANNGYLNAKALRALGVHADVLSHDYYHIMGCPEWEDAEVSGPWGDDFAPRWKGVATDFVLPPWFFRGPLDHCLESAIAQFDVHDAIPASNRPVSFAESVEGKLRSPGAAAFFASHPKIFAILRYVRRSLQRAGTTVRKPFSSWVRHGAGFQLQLSEAEKRQAQANEIVSELSRMFPDRIGQADGVDVLRHTSLATKLRRLFDHYDIVHAYATNPIQVWLSGKRPYVAYEHGTIRQLPFEKTADGLCLAGAYRQADVTVITNCDNKLAAERLELDPFVFVPHPVNEEFLASTTASETLRRKLQDEQAASFVLLHPSRQHWSEQRDPSLEKGNDILIRGFARVVKEVDPQMLLVMVDWGQMVDESKALLRELGCADRVLWIPPQPHRSFARWINASDAIADQFYLGAFGSLTPKAMACGKPVLLNLNEEMHEWCFERQPPVLNTKTPDDVFDALRRISTNPDECFRIGAESKAWYEAEHSMDVVAHRLTGVYERALT